MGFINKNVENRYTDAIQLVTAAISTGDRLDPFDYCIYHRSFESQEKRYLQQTTVPDSETDKAGLGATINRTAGLSTQPTASQNQERTRNGAQGLHGAKPRCTPCLCGR